jgi:hypothetical protein
MKTRIFLNGKEIFSSNKISKANLQKKVEELKRANGCMKITDIVRKGFVVFTS